MKDYLYDSGVGERLQTQDQDTQTTKEMTDKFYYMITKNCKIL